VTPTAYALAAAGGYLVGSLSFARLVARGRIDADELRETSFDLPNSEERFRLRSVSATSVSMRLGPRYGCLVSLLDMAKAFGPTLWLKLAYPGEPLYLIYALGCVLGHNFPLYHRFAGGRGLSPIMGALLAVDWLALPVTLTAGNLIGLGLLRDPFTAYNLWIPLLMPWFWWRFGEAALVWFAAGLFVLFLLASWNDFRQYFRLRFSGEYTSADMMAMVEQTDMGRGLKYMRKYGLIKDEPADSARKERERE